MAKKKPVVVTITKHKPRGKNDNQVWKVRIEGGKSDLEIPQRYTRLHSAKMGALRKLKAESAMGFPVNDVRRAACYEWYDGTGRPIQFEVKPKTTKSK